MSESVTQSCPSCGSAVNETDINCRNCGFRIQSGNENLIRRGRNIVILVVIISLFLEFLGFLAEISSAYLEDRSVEYLDFVIRIPILLVILYLTYRGYSFARWLLGILYIVTCVVGLFFLTKVDFYSFNPFALGLMVLIGSSASAAGLLLIPRSVRIFQDTQRKSIKKGSNFG